MDTAPNRFPSALGLESGCEASAGRVLSTSCRPYQCSPRCSRAFRRKAFGVFASLGGCSLLYSRVLSIHTHRRPSMARGKKAVVSICRFLFPVRYLVMRSHRGRVGMKFIERTDVYKEKSVRACCADRCPAPASGCHFRMHLHVLHKNVSHPHATTGRDTKGPGHANWTTHYA